MSNFDFTAHRHLSGTAQNTVQEAIELAHNKSHLGTYQVCKTDAGEVLVLPQFSADVRDDITEVLYDTDYGYSFTSH